MIIVHCSYSAALRIYGSATTSTTLDGNSDSASFRVCGSTTTSYLICDSYRYSAALRVQIYGSATTSLVCDSYSIHVVTLLHSEYMVSLICNSFIIVPSSFCG